MRLSLLDRAFYLLDGARSPQDFTVIFDLRHVPDVERLVAGARSAMNRFPTSACTVEGRAWVWRENKFNLETSSAIEDFIDKRFDLRREQPIKQLLVLNGSSARLATRFHHAAADGFSAALWLGHQLNVLMSWNQLNSHVVSLMVQHYDDLQIRCDAVNSHLTGLQMHYGLHIRSAPV